MLVLKISKNCLFFHICANQVIIRYTCWSFHLFISLVMKLCGRRMPTLQTLHSYPGWKQKLVFSILLSRKLWYLAAPLPQRHWIRQFLLYKLHFLVNQIVHLILCIIWWGPRMWVLEWNIYVLFFNMNVLCDVWFYKSWTCISSAWFPQP